MCPVVILSVSACAHTRANTCAHTQMCACTHVCVCTCAHICVQTQMYTRAHTYTCMYTQTHTNVHAHMCMHTHACTNTNVHAHTQTHTQMGTDTNLHITQMHTCTNMHTHTHTHTHTHMNMHSLLPGPPTFLWCLLLPGMFARIARHFLQHSALSLPCSPSPSLPAQKRVLKFHPAHPRILVHCPYPVTAGTWRQAWC